MNENTHLKTEYHSAVERIFGKGVSELEELGDAFQINACTLDQFVIALLSCYSLKKPIFLFLIECFNRAVKETDENLKEKVLFLIFSYAGLVLQNVEMFPQSAEVLQKGDMLFCDILYKTKDKHITKSFMDGLLNRWKGDDVESVLIEPIFSGLLCLCRTLQISDIDFNQQNIYSLFELLLSYNNLFALYMESSLFLPNCASKQFELSNPLALLCTIFVTTPKIIESYFAIKNEKPAVNLENSLFTFRSLFYSHHSFLFKFFNSLVRINRIKVIEFFSRILYVGKDFVKLHYDKESVCSDGLVFNLNVVLLKLCEPFLQNEAKLGLITFDFYRFEAQLIPDSLTSTKLNVTEQEFVNSRDSLLSTKGENANLSINFISQAFFLCIEFFRIAIVRVMNELFDDLKEANELKVSVLPRIQQQLESIPPNHPMKFLLNINLQKVTDRIDVLISKKVALDTFFADESFMNLCFDFFSYKIKWLMSQPFSLQVYMPEYFLKDTFDFYSFMLRIQPKLFLQLVNVDQLFDFLTYFLYQKEVIKNPYLKTSIVELIFTAIDSSSQLMNSFVANDSVLSFMISALMDLYVQVEYTGASSQFYDKFNSRFYISRILKLLWESSSQHRSNLTKLSNNSSELFTKFVNYLLNDVSYLLGESLEKLISIHDLQMQMAKPDFLSSSTPQERTDMEKTLAGLEKTCTGYMNLTVENMDLLSLTSSLLVEPFMRPEIVDRLSAMLNYNLAQLVGPKCSSLRVQNPSKYNFKPISLLGTFMDIYNHLSCKAFALALARDERSYSKQNYERHISLVQSRAERSTPECDKYRRLVNAVERFVQSGQQAEQEMGDVPDEFLDPLMCLLMEDPVILPTSKVTVDRSTIATHLLNNPTDPFNRSPLSIDQVVPNTELKLRIDEFRKKGRCNN